MVDLPAKKNQNAQATSTRDRQRARILGRGTQARRKALPPIDENILKGNTNNPPDFNPQKFQDEIEAGQFDYSKLNPSKVDNKAFLSGMNVKNQQGTNEGETENLNQPYTKATPAMVNTSTTPPTTANNQTDKNKPITNQPIEAASDPTTSDQTSAAAESEASEQALKDSFEADTAVKIYMQSQINNATAAATAATVAVEKKKKEEKDTKEKKQQKKTIRLLGCCSGILGGSCLSAIIFLVPITILVLVTYATTLVAPYLGDLINYFK